MPAVRQAIDKQNAERTAAGETAIAAGPLLELAEKLVPKVRAAEWRDRAEAAQKDLETLDLRDLRSVVSAADSAPRDDESRALVQVLRDGLSSRVDAEHAAWLAELTANVEVGRIVRALRLSSRPPKAGAPLPAELATKLTEQAGAALTADAAPERWVAVLDALAFSPVRDKVIPTSLPTGDLHADVQATIARLATRVPKLAHIFEIAPDPKAPRPERRRPPKPKKPKAEGRRPRGRRPRKPRPRTPPRSRLRRSKSPSSRWTRRLQIPRSDDRAFARPALEVAALSVLVPPCAAGRAGARVERQRREVEPLDLVRLAERAAQVMAPFGRRHRAEPTASMVRSHVRRLRAARTVRGHHHQPS